MGDTLVKDFAYAKPKTVDEAVRLVASQPTAKFLGGGTNLIDLARYGVEEPDSLVDVAELPMGKVEDLPDGGLRIGALVPNSDLAQHERVKRDYRVLSEALLAGASPQLRNMATSGGNLLQRTRCYYFYDTALPCNKREPGSGCPAIEGINRIHAILGQSDHCIAVHPSDMCVALAALDAVVQVQGPNGPRSIRFEEFHRLPGDTPQRDTNLEHGELIISIDLPKPASTRSHYLKVRDRQTYAFALVSVAAVVDMDGDSIRSARIALGGVAHKPWRAHEAEQALQGQPATRETFARAAQTAVANAKGYKYNSFKIEVAKRAIVKCLEETVHTV